MSKTLIVAMAATVGLAACSKPAEQKAQEAAKSVQQGATKTQQGADDMAKGLQQMAQGLQQMAQGAGQTATPLPFEKLETALPTVSGWTRAAPEGHSLAMPVAVSNTSAVYSKGDARVTLTITDTAFSQLVTAPLMMLTAAGYSEKTSSGYKRHDRGRVAAHKSGTPHRKDGTIGVIAAKRFMVEAKGSQVDSIDTLKDFVQKIDFKACGLEMTDRYGHAHRPRGVGSSARRGSRPGTRGAAGRAG